MMIGENRTSDVENDYSSDVSSILAAPVDVVSRTDRTLARELNVGILGVNTDG